MDDIATAAGVHRTTVYEYFPNRDALLAGTFAREAAEVIRRVGKHLTRQRAFGEGLVWAIAAGIEETHRSPQLSVLLAPGNAGRTVHAVLASEAFAEQVRAALVEPVSEAIRRGEVRDDVPREALLSWIVRIALSVTTEPPHKSAARVRETLRRFLLPALAPPS
jgi:AcrR family transcriptional regulator